MKRWLPTLALLPFAWGVWAGVAEPQIVLFVTGDTFGELSPCGCTKPMSGGMRRRFTAIDLQKGSGRYLVLDNGAWVAGRGRQDELKAETLAEAYGRLPEGAVSLTRSEADLGPGVVGSLQRLTRGIFVSADPGVYGIPTSRELAPFRVVTFDPDHPASVASLHDALTNSAAGVILTSAGLERAIELARSIPEAKLVVYRSQSLALTEPKRVGHAWLVSPGDHGKELVRLTWRDGEFRTYQVTKLGPEFGDQAAAQRSFATYVSRVKAEKLLEKVPRTSRQAFIGSAACRSCHSATYHHWLTTGHARALKSLEEQKQDRDPDCTRCHVVGLESIKGFKDRTRTPDLANVGCESCHGSGAAHAMKPVQNRLAKVTAQACQTCHEAAHSPGFDFSAFWAKIRHPGTK